MLLTEVGPFVLELVLAAFAGGVFGAALGALPSFVLAGVVITGGEAATMVRRGVTASVDTFDPTVLGSSGLTGLIGLGPLLGPHVAFAGGAAAAAFAARESHLDGDDDYHLAKAFTRGLGSRPDVLLVGGVFGIFGHVVATILGGVLQLPMDPWRPPSSSPRWSTGRSSGTTSSATSRAACST